MSHKDQRRTYILYEQYNVMKKLEDGEAASLMDPRLTRSQAADLAVESVLTLASECLLPTRREERLA
ncbi:hypothetical protein EJ110_NYTH00150 [Nymphaea thermarum]|nr:hypothetical protein EJ110_NYTH00150 [Nymphaea thermarum]